MQILLLALTDGKHHVHRIHDDLLYPMSAASVANKLTLLGVPCRRCPRPAQPLVRQRGLEHGIDCIEGSPGGDCDGGLRLWQPHRGGGLAVVPGQVVREGPLEHAVYGIKRQQRVDGDVRGPTITRQAIAACNESQSGNLRPRLHLVEKIQP